jgi:hypothetical protein
MTWFNLIKIFAVTVLVALCSACATSPAEVNTDVVINFPKTDTVTSVEQADTVLEAVSLSKAQIDWRYKQKEQICYTRFFVNHCLLSAKNEKRVDLAQVKKMEVEANRFKRKDNVEQMDRALAEKNLANPLPDPDKSPESDAVPAPDTPPDSRLNPKQ